MLQKFSRANHTQRIVQLMQRGFFLRDPSIKRTTYKVPSAIRKGKMPVIGFRTSEDTILKQHPINPTESERVIMIQKRRISHQQFRNIVVFLMFFSLVPLVYLIRRSSDLLKRFEVKSVSRKRRERLDKEHGIDRDEYNENIQKLDYAYRVSEKEEIQKMRQLGKNPMEILEKKKQMEEEDDSGVIIEEQLLQGENKIIQVKKGKDFERVEVSSSLDDVPDPRIHGAKIIFDSRLDQTMAHYNESRKQPSMSDIKNKDLSADEIDYPDYPMITLEDKKKALLESFPHKEETPSFRKKRQAEADDGTETNKEEKLRQVQQAFVNFKKLMVKRGVPTNYINYIYENFKDRLINGTMSEEEINQFFMYLATHIPKVKFVKKMPKVEKKSKPIEEYTIDYLCEAVKSRDALETAKAELNSEFKDFIIKTIEKEILSLQTQVESAQTKNYESIILNSNLNKLSEEYSAHLRSKDQEFDKKNYINKFSNMLQKLSILEEYLKNNPIGDQSPLFRSQIIKSRKALLEKYNASVFETNYQKINEVDKMAKRIIRNNDDSSKMFERELKKYVILKELEDSKLQIIGEKPLQLEQIVSLLNEFENHSSVMKLPDVLVENAKKSIISMIANGVPTESDVEASTRCLSKSLKNLVSLLEFERFHDITLEELQSRLTTQRVTNYFLSFKSYIYSNVVVPNDILSPDNNNFQNFKNIGEAYKNMNKEEKEKLHGFDTIENCLKEGKILPIYEILQNNDKFISLIVDGDKHLQVIEDYLVHKTLKDIQIGRYSHLSS